LSEHVDGLGYQFNKPHSNAFTTDTHCETDESIPCRPTGGAIKDRTICARNIKLNASHSNTLTDRQRNLRFISPLRFRWPKCISSLNFIKISQTVFEISRFFLFPKWLRLQSWILADGSRGWRCIIMPNFGKIDRYFADIGLLYCSS